MFLCDVMGHGVRAALGTAIVRTVVEEISHREKDPGPFLEHMNQVLLPILRQEQELLFATACYMILDVAAGTVRLAIAGHPPPIWIDADRQHAEWLLTDRRSAGPALALCEGAAYETVERGISPGDAVLLFTDGICEVAGADREEFGEERLLAAVQRHQALALPALFPQLLNEARLFAAEGGFEDDICLAGFRLKGLLPD